MKNAAAECRLSTLDYVLAAVDSPRKPADFGIVFHFKTSPCWEAMRAGAQSARNLFPVSGSVIAGKRWTPAKVDSAGIAADSSAMDSAESFLNRRIDLRKDTPIQQMLLKHALVTHVHHAAADGFSAGLWLHHQFRVAAGLQPAVTQRSEFEPVGVRHVASKFAGHRSASLKPSQELWTEHRNSAGVKRWRTVEIPALPFEDRCRRHGVRAADALAAAAFETLADWNRRHGAASRRIGLWIPVNIRKHGSAGFGNGTSRIRVHPGNAADSSFTGICREIRRNVQSSLRRGEWTVPEATPAAYLPFWVSGPLINAYLNRRRTDMGTIAFSYVDHWSGAQDGVFQDVEKIECVGQLHERHALAINAVRHGSSLWITFTYDSARLADDDVRHLSDVFQHQAWGQPSPDGRGCCEAAGEGYK